ncbi:hypothetical protein O181_042733 [Austropuccinia psidii MF-1]|uniref:Uncharacterized protein n=1 Tax=Austropuccinia psidii MF-1 TaxID=1389203 RepID=A0A9Q3HF13_9BASI|nr:hypothetical protein [Austropuccinia psidii MF-1]
MLSLPHQSHLFSTIQTFQLIHLPILVIQLVGTPIIVQLLLPTNVVSTIYNQPPTMQNLYTNLITSSSHVGFLAATQPIPYANTLNNSGPSTALGGRSNGSNHGSPIIGIGLNLKLIFNIISITNNNFNSITHHNTNSSHNINLIRNYSYSFNHSNPIVVFIILFEVLAPHLEVELEVLVALSLVTGREYSSPLVLTATLPPESQNPNLDNRSNSISINYPTIQAQSNLSSSSSNPDVPTTNPTTTSSSDPILNLQKSISSTDLQQASSSQDLNSSHDPISDLTAQPATKPINGSNPTGSNILKG